jgi:hypothetical protein
MYVGKGQIVFEAPDPISVKAIFPQVKTVQYRGKRHMVLKHDLDTVSILRNLGIEAPSPVNFDWVYPGRYQPFQHQRATVEFLTLNRRAFVLSGMGCIAGDERVRVSRKSKSYETTLRELHNAFHAMPDKHTWKVRSLKGDRFGMNVLQDSLYKGEQPTLRFTLADGKTFRCTPDHHIARPGGGWTAAENLVVGDALVTNGKVTLACPKCGVSRDVDKYYVSVANRLNRVCNVCRYKAQGPRVAGDKNPAYKGTPFTDNDGYVRLWLPDHHRADNSGRVYEHIMVAEAAYGISITAEYHVHHRNGVKDDNRIENLEVLLAGDHHRHHDPRAKLDGSISAKGGMVVVLPKQATITAIEDGGVTDVYDLCMEAPHHNFVVNGVVVHNSGKTKAALWAVEYMKERGVVDRVVIVCPKSCTHKVWEDEIFGTVMHRTAVVIEGSRERKRELAESNSDFIIVNHDGLITIADIIAKDPRINLVIYDEFSSIRNGQTRRYKVLKSMLKPTTRLWLMSATPCPNAPTDAWAPAKLVRPESVPPYFLSFKRQTMYQVTTFKWVAKPEATQMAYDALQPAIRFKTEDCIDLPEVTYQSRQCDLSPEQIKMSEEMRKHLVASNDGHTITAANAAVKLMKLLQIYTGCCYDDTGTPQLVQAPSRLETLKEMLEEADRKVIVWCPFKHVMNHILKELNDWDKGTKYAALINGDTSAGDRAKIITAFQDDDSDLRVLIAHPATAAHGLTLTAANVCVWYGPTFSAELFEQANARVNRPGQKHKMTILRLGATPVEWAAYAVADAKVDRQKKVLDLYKNILSGSLTSPH